MKRKWILIFALILISMPLLAFFAYGIMKSMPFTSENFPLSEKWSTKIDEDVQQMTIVDDKIILARTLTKIYALDMATGKVLWHQNMSFKLSGIEPIATENELVLLIDGTGLWALT